MRSSSSSEGGALFFDQVLCYPKAITTISLPSKGASSLIRQILACSVAVTMLASCQGPGLPLVGSSTLKRGTSVTLPFKRDTSYTAIDVYRTTFVDVDTAAQGEPDSGVGHFGFHAVTGTGGSDGYSVEGVDSSMQDHYRQVTFINMGTLKFDDVREAPEFGYNSPLPGKKSRLEKIASGNVIAFKVSDKNKGTSFGKFQVKDLNSSAATVDYVWQSSGARQF